MKQQFKDIQFRQATLQIIEHANFIIEQYQADGYDLTLRQVYYQFVARNLFPEDKRWRWTGSRWVKDPDGTKNAEPNYSMLGTIINNGRLAGLIDWDAIRDRTRSIGQNSHWNSPAEIIQTCAHSYKIDTREDQDVYLEAWVEKEALVGVLERACQELDIPWFACRGYVSQSAMYEAARRCKYKNADKVVILHLGDHDPSGIDMTRDNNDRLEMFGVDVTLERLALNMDQVEHYNPPSDPAKMTDSRYGAYMEKYGEESWELDALEPKVIIDLITDAVKKYTDPEKQRLLLMRQDNEQSLLERTSDDWELVVEFLNGTA